MDGAPRGVFDVCQSKSRRLRAGGPRSLMASAASLARGKLTRSESRPSGQAILHMPGQSRSGTTRANGVRVWPSRSAKVTSARIGVGRSAIAGGDEVRAAIVAAVTVVLPVPRSRSQA